MGIDIRALAITVLLAFALYFTYGQFELAWITILPIVLALVVGSLATPLWFKRNDRFIALAIILFFLGVSAASLLPESKWLRSMIVDVADQTYIPYMRGLFAAAALATVALCVRPRAWILSLVLACMIGAFALVIPTSPRAQIDVWTVHEEGAQAFIEGRNPYTHEYTNIYPEELRPALTPGGVTYSYLPGVFMWMAPWKAMGLDTRFSQLITRLCTAVLLVLIALRARGRRDFMMYVPALLFITFPLNTFFIVRAWNDDISMMCYALAAYGMLSRKPWALFIATNFLLLHKQHAIFFVPVLIWYAWRAWSDRLAWLRGTFVAALVCGGYLIADWRNFLGSLYGLTFLKFPNIHTVFLERRDPYSLMNFLNLYTGFKSSWFFLAVVGVLAFIVLRKNWRKPDAASVLRGLGAMGLALFAFAPIAFANYYEFALGLILIGYAATGPALRNEWELAINEWQLAYITVRALILFNFASLIVETREFGRVAEKLFSGQVPYTDFAFPFLPFALIPTFLAAKLSSLGNLREFLAFHTLWQLTMLICDVIIAWIIFRRAEAGRVSKLALLFFVFGPLLVASVWFTSPVLITALFVWLAVVALKRVTSHARAGALVAEKYDGRVHARLALFAGAALTIAALACDLAGFDIGYQPLISPTHAVMWFLLLLPLCPPLKSRVQIVFAVALTAVLALSASLLHSFETVYLNPDQFKVELWIRNGLLAACVVLLALSLRKERSA